MPRPFYQTPTALFRSNCFFNSLLRCRAPTLIQKTFTKVWRSISKACSSHCGASTKHGLVSAMAWYFARVEYACGSLGPCQWNFFLVREVYDSILEICFLHWKYCWVGSNSWWLEPAGHYGANESQIGDCENFVPNGGLGRQTLPIEVSTCTSDCTLTWKMAG